MNLWIFSNDTMEKNKKEFQADIQSMQSVSIYNEYRTVQ